MLDFPDPLFGWYRPAVACANELLAKQSIDVILATSPPRVAPLIARDLARRHHLPWVLDLRDPWMPPWKHSGATMPLIAALLQRLFRACTKSATAIVHNTERLRRDTSRLVPASSAKTYCIPNGFEPDFVGGRGRRTRGFSIGYYGNITGDRSATIFLEGLRRWIDRGPQGRRLEVKARFTGAVFGSLRTSIDALGLDDVVTLSPSVSRAEVPSLMVEDFMLLLLANNQPLQVPGKAYDYLASCRRILAMTERDSATADLLGGAPGCAITETADEVAEALDTFYRAYSRDPSGYVERGEFLADAAYPRRAGEFARLLREVCELPRADRTALAGAVPRIE
jgi:hypothetical protein